MLPLWHRESVDDHALEASRAAPGVPLGSRDRLGREWRLGPAHVAGETERRAPPSSARVASGTRRSTLAERLPGGRWARPQQHRDLAPSSGSGSWRSWRWAWSPERMCSREEAPVALRLRLGRLLGLTCFVVALLTYRSYSHHPLLGRWSYAFAAVLLGAIGAWLAALIGSWRSAQAGADGAVPGPATALLDVGFLCWGGAYLLSSIDAPATAAKIIDLNLFGSATPSSALLAWIALLATTLAAAIAVFRRLAPRYPNPAVACGAVILFALVGEGAARVKAVAAPATE